LFTAFYAILKALTINLDGIFRKKYSHVVAPKLVALNLKKVMAGHNLDNALSLKKEVKNMIQQKLIYND